MPRRRSVTNVNNPPVGLPTISGTPTEDQTLTANTGGISDADGLGTFSYQWLRDGATIGGATASTYTLGDADVGAQISVQVSYTDGGSTAEGPLTSTPVGPVANINDAPVGIPTISGTASKGQTLTADASGISDADGLGTFSYQWLREWRRHQRRDRQHVPAGQRRRRHADHGAGDLHRWSQHGRGTADQCADGGGDQRQRATERSCRRSAARRPKTRR